MSEITLSLPAQMRRAAVLRRMAEQQTTWIKKAINFMIMVPEGTEGTASRGAKPK